MTDRATGGRTRRGEPASPPRQARKRYESPRLVDYGPISKLTQSGGATLPDKGSNNMQHS